VCACHDAPCTAMSQLTTGALAARKSSGRQQASPDPLNRRRSSAGIHSKDITASRTEERSPARGSHSRHRKTRQPFDQIPPKRVGVDGAFYASAMAVGASRHGSTATIRLACAGAL
jgi:hypothetical protein